MCGVSARHLLGILCLLASVVPTAEATPPRLYSQPFHQSPVRGDPDDLLLLAGLGLSSDDVVVYMAVANTEEVPPPPVVLPTEATAASGLAEIASVENVPYSLTVHLPAVLRRGQTYALWVRTARGDWSNRVLINDARPLWITPAFVPSTGTFASLPRAVKVIGRNLAPAGGAKTRIRLSGPSSITLNASPALPASPTTDQYVARADLPAYLPPGRYKVAISRDGVSWVSVVGQTLEVRPPSLAGAEYDVSDPRYGGCRPDSGSDTSDCLIRAVGAARANGGGTVRLGPGTWDLIDSAPRPGLTAYSGIVIADHVSLRGAGAAKTTLRRTARWTERLPIPAITLIGHTSVSGFRFQDAKQYAAADSAGAFVRLGTDYVHVSDVPGTPRSVDEVVVTENTFDKTFVAIADAGLPIRNLFVTRNEFGAYYAALELTGNRFNMEYPFRIDDSVISNNIFKPGSLLDWDKKIGSMASELGASLRMDFSDNAADGTSTDFLYRPDDPHGWLAAFFWHMNNNTEELLVANNSANCTGDKIGDGAALSFDNNANTFALDAVKKVMGSDAHSVSVAGPLVSRQNFRVVPVATYYRDHWIQVVSGPGVGQVRKITSYEVDPRTGTVHFVVAPAWDVVPESASSRIAVGREFWQVYAIANNIDHRQPLCQKSNRSRKAGGGIGMWAQTADSVIDGNRQFDTDGILTQQNYLLPKRPCSDCNMESFFQYFLDIRGNFVDGEYDWATDCSASGIATGIAAVPWDDPDPPVVGYGVSIAHNVINHADAAQGGAISLMASWYSGPPPARWPLSNNTLIHHNIISNVDGLPASAVCGQVHPRSGIHFPQTDIAWRTVLYGNVCHHVARPIVGTGVHTVRWCPTTVDDSCECADRRP